MFWKHVRNIGLMLLSILGWVLFSLIPDDSIIKNVFAVIIVIVIVLLILMYTPLGNPLKKLYRRFKDGE